MATRVTIWNEFKHEKRNPVITEIYPQGMHEAIASHLRKSGADLEIRTATLDQPSHGLTLTPAVSGDGTCDRWEAPAGRTVARTVARTVDVSRGA